MRRKILVELFNKLLRISKHLENHKESKKLLNLVVVINILKTKGNSFPLALLTLSPFHTFRPACPPKSLFIEQGRPKSGDCLQFKFQRTASQWIICTHCRPMNCSLSLFSELWWYQRSCVVFSVYFTRWSSFSYEEYVCHNHDCDRPFHSFLSGEHCRVTSTKMFDFNVFSDRGWHFKMMWWVSCDLNFPVVYHFLSCCFREWPLTSINW